MIRVRKIELEDLDSLLELRNLEFDRPHYEDSSEISLSDHQEWVTSRVDSEQSITLVAEANRTVIGVCYLNHTVGKEAELSIRVFPEWRGTECANLIFTEVASEAQKQGIERLIAVVHIDNKRSRNFFIKIGFIELGIRNEFFQEFALDLRDFS